MTSAGNLGSALLIVIASAASAAMPQPDLTKELSEIKGSVSAVGTPVGATTLFTRLRDQVEDIGDTDRSLFMAILGDCLSPSGIPGDVPDCTEFDAKDLAARAPAERQLLRRTLVRWPLTFGSEPALSEFSLGQFDFAKRVFPVRLKGKLCNSTLEDRCVIPSNPGLARDPPEFEIRFDVPVRQEALARAIAALRPDQPGVTWSPTAEILYMPTGRVAPQAYRKRLRVEDWIEVRLLAMRLVIEVPASAVPKGTGRSEDAGEDDEGTESDRTIEIVLAEYYFK